MQRVQRIFAVQGAGAPKSPLTNEEIYLALVSHKVLGGGNKSGAWPVLRRAVAEMDARKIKPFAVDPKHAKELSDQISQKISDLGSTVYAERAAADQALRDIVLMNVVGAKVDAALRDAAKSADLEVKTRAGRILQFSADATADPLVAVYRTALRIEEKRAVDAVFRSIATNNPAIWPPELVQWVKAVPLPPP